MNKTELTAAMAETSGLSKKDCEAALAAFTGAVETAMKSGDKVQMVGFGSFEVKKRPARVGRNPRTGEPMTYPACKVPVFKPGTQGCHSVKPHNSKFPRVLPTI